MPGKILNYVLFQAGWFACVLGGAHNMIALPIAAAGLIVGVRLWLAVPDDRLCDLRLYLAVGSIGFCLDSLHLSLGVFALIGTPRFPHLCPLWLVALWVMFGTTLRGSLSGLANRYGLAALLGAVAGPLSYLSGARLGAVTLPPDRVFSLFALAVGWAVVLPLLVWLAHGRCRTATPQGIGS